MRAYRPRLAKTPGTIPGRPSNPNAASLNIDNISQIDQVAAGSYVSLYGTSLAKGIDGPAFPLPPGDQGTQVKLGNRTLLMTYVEPKQVNVLLPSDLPPAPQQSTMVRED